MAEYFFDSLLIIVSYSGIYPNTLFNTPYIYSMRDIGIQYPYDTSTLDYI